MLIARPVTSTPQAPSTAAPVLRFAPSPNGRLHLGHAFSALTTARLAEALGGIVLLRIEDIDLARSRRDNIDAIFDDLSWLGLSWPAPVLLQSTRFGAYRDAATSLRKRGLIYPCAATRADRAAVLGPDVPKDPDGAPRYTPICRRDLRRFSSVCSAEDPEIAWRLDMEKAIAAVADDGPLGITTWDGGDRYDRRDADPSIWGDPVLIRKDTPASYHLAVVVDDAYQSVTHVTRGADLEPATDLHRLLQALLGLPSPAYHHHGLIRAEDGRKLAKSAGDTTLGQLRATGVTQAELLAAIGL
ncbi:MAG: tRNA glutamyl-Q(34) synthetase GluQRS [Pseudomonadota bacterium]